MRALSAWMAGEGLDVPVCDWFPFRMPAPSVAPDLIDGYIASYEARRDGERDEPFDAECEYWWTASLPVLAGGSGSSADLVWWNLGEEVSLRLEREQAIAVAAAMGESAASGPVPGGPAIRGSAADGRVRSRGPVNPGALASLSAEAFRALRHNGLCRVNPPSSRRG